MICGERSIVNDDGDNAIAISLRCRAWTCEHCRPRRRQQLIRLARAGTPNRLITLTASPAIGVSPADRAAKLARAWRIVVARAKRQLKLPALDYLAVFEATKRGEPHLHILARCGFIPQRWLSGQMREITGSPIVDIRKVKSVKHAALYVAKYIGKAPHRFATCKRYWYTQRWTTQSPDEQPRERWGNARWELDDQPIFEVWKRWGGAWSRAFWISLNEICYRGQPPPGVAAPHDRPMPDTG